MFDRKRTPDVDGLLRCVLRKGIPERVYHLELYLDGEIISAVAERFDLAKHLNPNDPLYLLKRDVIVHQFLGYDMFHVALPGFDFPLDWHPAEDATSVKSQVRTSRNWMEEHQGPIQSWKDFECYPWPDIKNVDTRNLEWCEKNLPDDMAVFELTSHVFEILCWIFGYESLCYKVYEEPDLVETVVEKIGQLYLEHTRLLCQFSRMAIIWASDDMGFKTQPLLSPDHLRKLVLPWHKKSAEIAHSHDKPYFLHACGQIDTIMEDLIDDVGIDAKHSFEDAIEPVTSVKARYGRRTGIIGGIDVDFLCRANEKEIRRRVRQILDACHPDGGYILGTGNSVANYIPLDHYLVMLDEGRNWPTS
jgi:uroporphyrinogen decarboxylase